MNKVRDIHNSNLYGIIVETGCSTATSSKLMDKSGASKSILYAFQPYSKELEEVLYGEFPRSVSKEFIESVLDIEIGRIPKKLQEKVNFILASSWQLNSETDPTHYAHGWFGIFDIQRKIKHYLHFSFNRNISFKNEVKNTNGAEEHRAWLIDMIGKIGVNILYTAINGDINQLEVFHPMYVVLDMAYTDKCDYYAGGSKVGTEVNYDLLLNCLEKSEGDYLLTFNNEEPIRIEDLLRKGEQFVIQKGSFNPLHHGHIDLMQLSLQKYNNSVGAFLISTFRYDKPHIDAEELKSRIVKINKAGYPLIICKSVYYYETFDLFKEWSMGNKRFSFPMGVDTLNRIYQTDANYVNTANAKNAGKNYLVASMTLRGYINNIIRNNTNFKFVVFRRNGYPRLPETEVYNGIIDYVDYNDDGVSSTAIREGRMKNKLDI